MSAPQEPRVKSRYVKDVVPKLKSEFGYTSAMQVPQLEKIVINMGVGDAIQNIKILDTAVEELTAIAGQKAIVRKAKKSVAQFKLREGMPIACMVTLRGERMWEFFDRLVQFTKELDEEERRALAENLTEEELAIYDLITRPAPELTDAETKLVKAIAHELLAKLKAERLVLDWRKQQQSRAAVRVAVETELDHLPRAFDVDTFQTKCDLVYQHIYDNYWDDGRSTYTSAA